MSGFISAQSGSEVCLLTDGAGYDNDGVIRSLGRKVTVGKVAKIAVTTRGNALIGEKHQRRLCDTADVIGVDGAIACFRAALPELASDPRHGGLDFLHWHIAAWSETMGLVRFSAHNLPMPFSDGEEPLHLTLVEPGKSYTAATNANAQTLIECGVTSRMGGESFSDFLERSGAAIMEAQRRTPAKLLEGQHSAEPQYLIGGQCDLTIVTQHGVSMKTLKTWPDKIGDKIDPFSAIGNVVSMSRRQPRALEKEQHKRHRQSA